MFSEDERLCRLTFPKNGLESSPKGSTPVIRAHGPSRKSSRGGRLLVVICSPGPEYLELTLNCRLNQIVRS